MSPAIPPLPFTSVKLSIRPIHYRCPRDWRLTIRLRDHDLWIVLGGQGTLHIDGAPLPLRAPMAVLLRPGELIVGTQEPDTPLEVVALHFTPRGGRAADVRAWAERTRAVPLRPAATWRELAEMTVSELTSDDGLARQQASPLAMSLLSRLWRLAHAPAAKEGDDQVEALIRAIQREPEHAWTLAAMARRARMGATRLNQRFRELAGQTPARWVIRCRVERAALLLRDTSMKIAAIAEACGYADVYFFARQFRQIMGTPPGAWRRMHAVTPSKNGS